MKTILIFDQCGGAPIQFFVLKGDYSHLNKAYINSTDTAESLQDELTDLIYNEAGEVKIKTYVKFPIKSASLPGAKVIICGFAP